MGHIQAHMVYSMLLHLLVNGTRHDVTGSQRKSLVIFLHKRFAIGQTEHTAIATHRLGDEEGGMGFSRMIERRGMELHKLHICHCALGTIYHCHTIASGYHRIGGTLIHCSTATSTHHRNLGKIGIYLLCIRIEHIGSIAVYVWGATGDTCAKMMLSDDLYGKVIFLDSDIGVAAHSLHQSTLYLGTSIIGMMQYSELRVTALTMQVIGAILFPVEIHAPSSQLFYLLGSIPHHLFHGLRVTDIVTGNHGVLDMLVKVVNNPVGHRCHTALRKRGVCLIQRCFANHTHLAFVRPCHFQGITHTGNSCTDNEKIILVNHNPLGRAYTAARHNKCKSNHFYLFCNNPLRLFLWPARFLHPFLCSCQPI